jgi:dihydroxy-acid dehydratase
MLVPLAELADRARALEEAGGYQVPESQTPWQQYFRNLVGGLDTGMTLQDAPSYRDTARKARPRDSH